MSAYDELCAYATRRGHRIALERHEPNEISGAGLLIVLDGRVHEVLRWTAVRSLGRHDLDSAARWLLDDWRSETEDA